MRTAPDLGYICFPPMRNTPMTVILSNLFWDKKVKIAILTLATFAALC